MSPTVLFFWFSLPSFLQDESELNVNLGTEIGTK